jgi:hypothetical protein
MKPLLGALLLFAAMVGAEPTVDGKLVPGEYAHQASVISDTATVSWSADGRGGLFLGVSAPTSGWVGLGLGSRVMDGAWIFMGYVKDGQFVFSEQKGLGHSHRPVDSPRTDQWAVAQADGRTTLEFHLPADRMPVTGLSFPFITAYAGAPDLATFHEDSLDGGTITVP